MNKEALKRAVGWFQPVYFLLTTGDAWHCDSEDALENGNGKRLYVVIQLHTAVAVL